MKDKNIVIFGAGAVGCTLGGWLAPEHQNLYFLDKEAVTQSLQKNGIELFWGDNPSEKTKISVNTINSLSELSRVDYVFLTVKNYSLDTAAKIIQATCKSDPIIVAFQNGVENQVVLPKYFAKIIYAVVGYNVWPDGPGRFGYQKKGPYIIGTMEPNHLVAEKKSVAGLMTKVVETHLVDDIQSVAYSKLIINLTNSLTTLIGHKQREVSSVKLFQKILTNMTYEGTQVMKAAGYKECSIGDLPSWRTMAAAAKLPQILTRGIFKKNIKKMVLSSMAQDILQNKSSSSELKTINGHLLEMAEQHDVAIPYNKAIYSLCSHEFTKDNFTPLDVQVVWNKIKPEVS